MKITKRQLRKIIQEEKQKLREAAIMREPTMSSTSNTEIALENAVFGLQKELMAQGFSRNETNEVIILEVKAILTQ